MATSKKLKENSKRHEATESPKKEQTEEALLAAEKARLAAMTPAQRKMARGY
jgi:hypothetical protein